ncbi:DotD/TraH family lipoprotein [Undibacterium sp. TS12]|uniref:DotD/TraH family lipoprotein n=1 Tax=Undibacterium sp. TS12 TaxID=2908202 RepID=UPI001F4CBB62|nr:DotD/TraH family lipoprotein [Undibacterium sp. TS12]MCH8621273.1 DotD/TraH family lipoprotein [Undibacterium sp. TS12]
MNQIKFAVSTLVVSGLLAGCQTGNVKVAEDQKSRLSETVSLQKQLLSTADSIERNSQLLAEATNTRAAVEKAQLSPAQQAKMDKSATTKEPYGMTAKISFVWEAGPIQEVARQMAIRSGYEYMQPEGSVPSIPVMVKINAKEQSIASILRDAGLQAGSRADIVVDEARRRVLVRFFE